MAAQEFGLPFIPPILGEEHNFNHGANFAVVGATALDLAFFIENNITSVPPFNSSLSVQLDWFQKLKPTLCSTPKGTQDSRTAGRPRASMWSSPRSRWAFFFLFETFFNLPWPVVGNISNEIGVKSSSKKGEPQKR